MCEVKTMAHHGTHCQIISSVKGVNSAIMLHNILTFVSKFEKKFRAHISFGLSVRSLFHTHIFTKLNGCSLFEWDVVT